MVKVMVAYSIDYKVRGKEYPYSALIEARDLKSAKKKIGKKHGYKTGNMVQIERVSVIGYF
jgi:hypothetical protein